MAKILPTILINEIQMATLKTIRKTADDKGVVKQAVLAGYKGNVIGALVRHGVLVMRQNGDARIQANPIALRPPHTPRASTLAKRAAEANETQAAA